MNISYEPRSIDIRIGDVRGRLIQLGPRTFFWKPFREMPQGLVPIYIRAIDKEGRDYNVFAILHGAEEENNTVFLSSLPHGIEVISPDRTPPVLIGSQPPQGAEGLPFNGRLKVILIFSEPILTYEATAKFNPPLELLPYRYGDISFSKNRLREMVIETASSAKLSPNTKYTLIVDGVQDLAGNKSGKIKLEFKTTSAEE